ncbi:MAG: hypothetical protein ACOY3I_01110 [Verrucomicrobiota bacterium]
MLTTFKKFLGLRRAQDSTDAADLPVEKAEGVVLRPNGGFCKAPAYERLWQLASIQDLKDSLGISNADRACCVKLSNEGETFLVFYDFTNDLSLGIFHAGKDSSSNPQNDIPTLVASDPVAQVLWRRLSSRVRWNGTWIAGKLYMGNGVDPNLVYNPQSNTIGIMGDNIAPLRPILNLTDIVKTDRVQSYLETGGLRFEIDQRLRNTNRNYVAVTIQGGEGENFSSSLGGQGSFCDPLEYKVTCPAPLPTNEQLALFIARDPKASGILRCDYMASTATIVNLFPKFFLSLGRDQAPPYHSGVSSEQFEPSTSSYIRLGIKVLLTYVCKDDRLGIVESAPSPLVMIETARENVTSSAVQVHIEKDTISSEAERWTGIRLYAAETCLDCVCERKKQWLRLFELPNETQTVMIFPWHVNARARTDLNRDGLLIDEARLIGRRPPEPVKYFAFAENRIYMAGNYEKPLRIFYTQQANEESSLIDTLDETLFKDLIPQDIFSDEITALTEFQGGAIAFAGKTAFAPATDVRQSILSSPLNQRVGAHWTNGYYYYLGQDFNLYRIQALPRDVNAKPIDTLASEKIKGCIREYANTTDAIFPHGAVDYVNGLWWIWVRAKFGGCAAFAFDFASSELTGPFYLPQFAAVTQISSSDGRMIGVTARGEIFVWDLRKLADSFYQFQNGSGIALTDSSATSYGAQDYRGFGVLHLPNEKSVLKGNLIRLQTGWINFGAPESEKCFYEFSWTVVKNSSGIVYLCLEADDDIQQYIYYGEVFGKERHHVPVLFNGNAARVTFNVWTQDGKDFAVRDWSIGWKKLTNK